MLLGFIMIKKWLKQFGKWIKPFLLGMGDAFNPFGLSNTLWKYRNLPGHVIDQQALEKDWKVVGKDMYDAMGIEHLDENSDIDSEFEGE